MKAVMCACTVVASEEGVNPTYPLTPSFPTLCLLQSLLASSPFPSPPSPPLLSPPLLSTLLPPSSLLPAFSSPSLPIASPPPSSSLPQIPLTVCCIHGTGEREVERVEEVLAQVHSEGGWLLLHNIQVYTRIEACT